MSNVLSKINDLGIVKPLPKVNDLVVGVRYKINSIKSETTKYGIAIVVDLETIGCLYLPARYRDIIKSDELLALQSLLKTKPLYIIKTKEVNGVSELQFAE